MPLRLLEVVLPEENLREVEELLREEPLVGIWYDRLSEQQTLLKILATAQETEHLMDLLSKKFSGQPWFRLILLPVSASLPRVEEPPKEEEKPKTAEPAASEQKKKERISRAEMYEVVQNMAQLTRVYKGMVVLSTVVAAVGLLNDNVAVIIGAMVIAPLLGPIIAQAMGTTLGDSDLTQLALRTNISGLGIALGLSLLMGMFLEVHPTGPELAARTGIGLGDLAVALASGGAGALAFTAGVPTVLVGVMVAVALLPPLATLGLLLGSGHLIPALGAGLLLISNIICVNLAAVVVFWLQGVRPTTWWEEKRAQQATKMSIVICAGLLLLLAVAIILAGRIKYTQLLYFY
ncbi:MAG: TIGR00341 family protein [Deltaproteobacteria bacterium]|nr:TIGR00341 family protein [Deltaproteobacteria bacterium]